MHSLSTAKMSERGGKKPNKPNNKPNQNKKSHQTPKKPKGSDKSKAPVKALYLIIPITKTSPVAFHQSRLMGEALGSTEAVLFSTAWTGNLSSATLFVLKLRVTLLFFVQHPKPRLPWALTNYSSSAGVPIAWA